MRTLVIENQYFPCILFYSLVLRIEEVLIENKEHFVKRSFRNRMQLPGPNGIQTLSVPLQSGKSKKVIDSIGISYAEDWRKNHWHSIKTLYKNAPYFEHYQTPLEKIYAEEFSTLFELNNAIHQFIMDSLNVEKKFMFTGVYRQSYDSTKYIDARNHIMPNALHIEGFMHKNYWQIFQDKIGYQPNMSILDLLMCEGPNAIEIL